MNSDVLQSLRRRLGAFLGLRVGLLWVGVVGGLALGLVLGDAVLDLPEACRAAAGWLLAAALLLVAGAGAWQWRRWTEERLARWLERTQPALGNRLINAVQLARQTGGTSVEECLRLETVALGRRTAAGVAVWPAVQRGVKLAGAAATLVVLLWLGFLVGAGDVVEAVKPRFLDPHGDHPPYSRLHFEVIPGGTQVLYGGQVEIRAKLTPAGAGVDKLWLVAQSGTNTLRTILFLAPDKTYFQTLANLREPTEYYVTAGRARSYRFPIRIRYTPQITLVEVTTTFPSYTGKPPRTAKLSPEPQALPAGTQVRFRVVSNRPLKGGELTLTPVLGGQVRHLPLKSGEPGNAVSGEFAFTEPVVFSLTVRDVSDLDSIDPRQGRFNLLPDERPRLFVLEPGRDAVATPAIRVPVRVEATDDYGITRVVWLRGLNRSIERPFNMKLTPKSGPQTVEAAGAFELAKLGVRPGDVIEYYFEAADNDPKGPNLALSRLYRLQIISQEQYELVLRQAAARKALFEPYFQLGGWLRRLSERARKLPSLAESSAAADQAAAGKETEALAEELSKYEGELDKLLQQATLFDIEQAFRHTLQAQQEALGQARQKLSQARGGGQLDPKKLAEAAQALSELAQTEADEVEQPARQLAAVAQLLARADTFVKLARQQAALAQLLRRFSGKTEPLSRMEQIELQELADHQRRVQDSLHAWLGSLPELVAKLPEEPQYDSLRADVNQFIQAVQEAKIEEDLAQNSKNLAALDGKAGSTLAQVAADKMDRLISKCSGLPKQGNQCLRFKPSVQQALRSSLEQILAAMGANPGNGQSGSDGYAMFNDDVALYGPNVELAGEQAGGRREARSGAARRAERVTGQTREPALKPTAGPGRVRLQPDARFPLRYRELVGEYFRIIAESEEGGNP